MTYIAKPKIAHPKTPRNKLGLTTRDYEGAISTLCAGCGHDSVTAALIQAIFELDIEPHMLAKMSGIGCSSKTPASPTARRGAAIHLTVIGSDASNSPRRS